MMITNQLPSRQQYSVFPSFITSTQIQLIKQMLPPEEELFPFKTEVVSRLQSRQLSLKKDSDVIKLINELLKNIGLQLSSNTIQPRIFRQGDFMDWHSDYDHLPINNDKLEYECVLILHNTSDSVTKFRLDTDTEKYHSVEGDLLIVCRNGIIHKVESPKVGERLTLKFTCISI